MEPSLYRRIYILRCCLSCLSQHKREPSQDVKLCAKVTNHKHNFKITCTFQMYLGLGLGDSPFLRQQKRRWVWSWIVHSSVQITLSNPSTDSDKYCWAHSSRFTYVQCEHLLYVCKSKHIHMICTQYGIQSVFRIQFHGANQYFGKLRRYQ